MKKINLKKMVQEEIKNVLNEDIDSSNNILEKYKNVPLKFSGYYKYSFSFRGYAPGGIEVYATIGGSADKIYKLEITADMVKTLGDNYENEYDYISIEKNGKEIFSWSN